jgi:hypothetical protein
LSQKWVYMLIFPKNGKKWCVNAAWIGVRTRIQNHLFLIWWKKWDLAILANLNSQTIKVQVPQRKVQIKWGHILAKTTSTKPLQPQPYKIQAKTKILEKTPKILKSRKIKKMTNPPVIRKIKSRKV